MSWQPGLSCFSGGTRSGSQLYPIPAFPTACQERPPSWGPGDGLSPLLCLSLRVLLCVQGLMVLTPWVMVRRRGKADKWPAVPSGCFPSSRSMGDGNDGGVSGREPTGFPRTTAL